MTGFLLAERTSSLGWQDEAEAREQRARTIRRLSKKSPWRHTLADVRFAAHLGLNSDIAECHRRATTGLVQRSIKIAIR